MAAGIELCPVCHQSLVQARRWRTFRLTLGTIEMGGAILTAVSLVRTGMSADTATALLVTTAFTAVSVLLFGGRRAL